MIEGQAAQSRSERLFLRSLTATDFTGGGEERALSWLHAHKEKVQARVEPIAFKDMKMWRRDTEDGSIRHESGRFFSIEGTRVTTNWGRVASWDQPIINQPEVGILGVDAVTKKPVVVESNGIESIAIKPMMYLSLSHDHRLVDGMLGGKFLKSVKETLENFDTSLV